MSISVSWCRVLVVVFFAAPFCCGCRAPIWRARLWPMHGGVAMPVQPAPAAMVSAVGPLLEGPALAGPPTKSATEIVLELRDEIADLEITRSVLEDRIKAQTAEIERLGGLLARAEQTIDGSRDQLTEARQELDAWQHELARLYEELRLREQRRSQELAELTQLIADAVAEYGAVEEAPADGEQLPPDGTTQHQSELSAIQ